MAAMARLTLRAWKQLLHGKAWGQTDVVCEHLDLATSGNLSSESGSPHI